MIKGVNVKKLKVLADERGRLAEILRTDDEMYTKFGQVYMTTCYPGVVKGWHFHKRQEDYFCCVHGMIKLVLYDPRESSPTKGEINEFFLGVHSPIVVQVPPGVYHGFKGISDTESIIINTITEPYNHKKPDEYRVAPHDGGIPYDWARKDK